MWLIFFFCVTCFQQLDDHNSPQLPVSCKSKKRLIIYHSALFPFYHPFTHLLFLPLLSICPVSFKFSRRSLLIITSRNFNCLSLIQYASISACCCYIFNPFNPSEARKSLLRYKDLLKVKVWETLEVEQNNKRPEFKIPLTWQQIIKQLYQCFLLFLIATSLWIHSMALFLVQQCGKWRSSLYKYKNTYTGSGKGLYSLQ